MVEKEVERLEGATVDESKQILISLSRLEENVKNLNTKIDDFAKVSELAFQTDQSVKSAHNRIDDIKKDFSVKLVDQKKDYEDKLSDQKEDFKELKGNITWLWRTVGAGMVSVAVGLIVFFMTKGG